MKIVARIIALGLASATLAACQNEAPAPAEDSAPDGMPGIAVTNARLILPAVKGNPGAVYFDITYSGASTAALRAADVAGASSAMLHDNVDNGGTMSMTEIATLPLARGETVSFAPGGKHVMAMELADTVQAGGKAEVTLTFAGGDKYSFEADVLPAGAER
jgi:periplasmic copper chaperone A